MECRVARKHLSAYVDSELEPSPMLEVEAHLSACAPCADELRLAAALKGEIKRQHVAACAPAHLRARVLAAMEGVEVEHEERQGRGYVGVTVLAVAASVVLVLGSVVGTDSGHGEQMAGMTPRALDIVRDVVSRHKDELPTEIATEVPEQATGWFRGKLSFRARPVEFAEPSVHFLGGRISQVGEQQAAKLYYAVGNSRLTVVMFKASPSMLQALRSERESKRQGGGLVRVGEREVTYHTLQGYTVPILEQSGIVYAFAGDLDQQSLLHLVGKARIPH
jgi:anti-sigma factor (TIGR02949 family)